MTDIFYFDTDKNYAYFDTADSSSTIHIATVDNSIGTIAKLIGVSKKGKTRYLLNAVCRELASFPASVNLTDAIIIEYYDQAITITLDNNQTADYLLRLGTGSLNYCSSSISTKDFFQKSYYINTAGQNKEVLASLNDSSPIKLDNIKAIGAGAYLTINYHSYFQQFNPQENDTLEFWVGDTIYEKITFDSMYCEFPAVLITRNKTGFFDFFKVTGNIEIADVFTKSIAELQNGYTCFYTEVQDKVTLYLSFNAFYLKELLLDDLMFNDLYLQLDNGVAEPVQLTSTELNRLATKDYNDYLKIEIKHNPKRTF